MKDAMITDIISHPIGLYALTAEGDLGFFSANQEFKIDREATATLQTRQLNLDLLREQLTQKDPERLRIAVIGRAASARDWGATSMFLEDSVVRDLYPVSGVVAAGLTAFQKKNQEKSVYRGMELLLEYRRLQYPDTPVYCPVLFDQGLTLSCYRGIGGCVMPENARARAVDVLNLISVAPAAKHNAAMVGKIKAKQHAALIHKEWRRAGQFEVLSAPRPAPASLSPAGEAYAEVDSRSEHQVAFTEQDVEAVRLAQRLALTQHWQEVSSPQRAAETLRVFTHFRDLSPKALDLIAAKATLFTATPGTRLLQEGTNTPWNLYLLEGQVQLASKDQMTVTVEAGTTAAKSAIAFLKPRKYTVTALTDARFWWVHDIVLQRAGVGV